MKRRLLRSASAISRATLAAIATGAFLLAAAAPASAGPIVDRTVTCLQGQPVCVDPEARGVLSGTEARQVRDRIEAADVGAFYVAVVPRDALDEVGGSSRALLREIHNQLHRPGTYALVAGSRFTGGSDFRSVKNLANEAFAAHKDEGAAAVLLAFVDRVDQLEAGSGDSSDKDYSVN